MKAKAKRLTALLLAMAMCLSLLSVNVWAAEGTADGSESAQSSEEAPEEEAASLEEKPEGETDSSEQEAPEAETPEQSETEQIQGEVPEKEQPQEKSAEGELPQETATKEKLAEQLSQQDEPDDGNKLSQQDRNRATALTLDKEYTVSVDEEKTQVIFSFQPSTKSYYRFTSYSNSGDPYCSLYDENGQELTRDDDGNKNSNFRLVYEMEAGKTYYYAVNDYDNPSSCKVKLETYEVLTSGTCGKDTTWELKDGVLTISGSGSIDVFREIPWSDSENSITSVVIKGGVTSIGQSSFSGLKKLTSVVIENGVVTIGESAFDWCTNLKSVDIPESVTTIEERAFENCSSLTAVTIPANVSKIEYGAFQDCKNLASVTLPENVSIENGAFSGTQWLKNMGDFAVVNGVLIEYQGKDTNPTIPNTVTSIGARTFSYREELKGVTIPSSVTSIGEGAFYACTNLTSVKLSEGLTEIGDGAFENCKSLTALKIPASVKVICDSAFRNCEKLASVQFPEGLTEIGDHTFEECTSLTEVKIPASVKEIGYAAFQNCEKLASVQLPEGVSLDSHVFTGTQWLKDMGDFAIINGVLMEYQGTDAHPTIPNSVTSIGGGAFSGREDLEGVTIPSSVTSIGESAFSGCTGMTSVEIPESVTIIEDYAFEDCPGLASVFIPASVTSLGRCAFASCEKLKTVAFGNSDLFYPENTFNHTPWQWNNFAKSAETLKVNDVRTVTITETHQYQPFTFTPAEDDWYTFYSCDNGQLDPDCDLVDIEEGKYETDYRSGEGNNFCFQTKMKAGKTYLFVVEMDDEDQAGSFKVKLEKYTPPTSGECGEDTKWNYANGVLTVSGTGKMWDFEGRLGWRDYWKSDITSVVVQDGVTSVGDYSFTSCKSLRSITLSDSVTSIRDAAFAGCEGLTNLTIPDSVRYIGDGAFASCTGLTSVSISGCNIGERAFSYCTNLSKVTFRDGLDCIERYAFYDTALRSVRLPRSVYEIYPEAFGYYFDQNEKKAQPVDGFKIYGYTDTAAEEYATKNGITFVDVEKPYVESADEGDFTGDDDVTMADVTLGNQVVVGMIQLTEEQKISADVTNDNDYTMADVVWTNGYVLGKHMTRTKQQTN